VCILSDYDHGEWCCGQLRTGEIGWLPRSYIAPIDSVEKHSWYHGVISRIGAEIILNNSMKGGFLVRESENNTGYTLSIRTDERVNHYRIGRTSENQLCIFGGKIFATIVELVHHYSRHTDGLETTLKYPAPKSDKLAICGTREQDEWEIDGDEIGMKRRINVGHYSNVYEGVWTKHQRKVAVKTLKVTSSTPYIPFKTLSKHKQEESDYDIWHETQIPALKPGALTFFSAWWEETR
jgi:hypothetical protein